MLNFTTLQATGPDAFPQRFGIIGDLGQTYNSSTTLRHLTETDPPVGLGRRACKALAAQMTCWLPVMYRLCWCCPCQR